MRRPQAVPDLGRESSAFFHNFGTDLTRKNNLNLIAPNIVIYGLGNSVVFEDLRDGSRENLLGLDEGGVGCVAVHPSKTMFATGGKGFQPNIYIYSYPELEILHVLKGGAERGYSSLSYNAHGTKLASVAMSPDFMLTVWDWKQGLIELHSKAFGQDVFGVKFSKDHDARLTTCGTGHIRFWKMASTFTGLKLQGDIGKFGKVELTDILAMEELPDGKVVSGSEVGALLLWEGHFIKCRFVQVGGAPCHSGNVTYIELDRTEKCLITAAEDGYVRWWDFNAIDTAEVDTDVTMDFELLPVAEYFVGEGCKVRSMLDCGNDGLTRSFVINDSAGRTQIVKFPLMEPLEDYEEGDDRSSMVKRGTFKGSLSRSVLAFTESTDKSDENQGKPITTTVSEYHSGQITGLDLDPQSHIAVTCGLDGNVRVWDYTNKTLLSSRHFDCAATSLVWCPPKLNNDLDKNAKHILVGFADGIVRCLVLSLDDEDKITLRQKFVSKPHSAAVCDIKFCEDSSYLCTSSRDGTIFILKTSARIPLASGKDPWTPVRLMIVAPGGNVKSPTCAETLCWKSDGNAILLSCTDGILREINVSSVPTLELECDTYEHVFPMKEFSGQVIKEPEAKKAVEITKVEDEGGEEGEASPAKPETNDVEVVPIEYNNVKVSTAIYKSGDSNKDCIYTGVTSSAFRMHLLEYDGVVGTINIVNGETNKPQQPNGELVMGLYTSDGKAQLKTPLPTALHYTSSKNFLGVGANDGSVNVRPSAFPAVFLRMSAHNGPVNFVRMSHDDKFVLSAGADGVLAVHTIDLEKVTANAEGLWKDIDAGVFGKEIVKPALKTSDTDIPPGLAGEVSPRSKELPDLVKAPDDAADIEEGAYSIQDAKLKNEEDAKRAIAEQVKDKQRALIRALQNEYEQIFESNQNLPPSVRLSPEQMTIDAEQFAILQNEGEEMISEVHKECRREAETAALLRDKVYSNLMDGMLIGEITLKSFSSSKGRVSNSVVRSMRTQGLPPAMIALLESAAKIIKENVVIENASKYNENTSTANVRAVNMQNMLEMDSSNKSVASNSQAHQSEDQHAASAGARREARRIRKENLTKHKKEEPKDDEDDERDVQAIDLAQRTVGDYKLKVAPDYEVPAELHVDAAKKKLQLALLEESMVKMRLSFNERFLALRDLKKEIVFDIRRSNIRIREIDAELDQEYLSERLWEPALDPAEYPEDSEYVVASELKAFSEAREKTKGQKDGWLKTKCVSGTYVDTNKQRLVAKNYATGEYLSEIVPFETTSFTDLHAPLSDPEEMKTVPDGGLNMQLQKLNDAPLKAYVVDADDDVLSRAKYVESIVPVLKNIQNAKKAINLSTDTEVQARKERKRLLNVEREWLLSTIDANVNAFREAMDSLRVDRHSILADLKLTELKLLALFQEYSILQNFESRDLLLAEKQTKSKKELASIELEVSDQQATLETKEAEKVLLVAETAAILVDFESMLLNSHPYYDQLRKIYRRKIKRGQAADDGEEEEEEETEEEENEEEEDEEADDACPPGCDPSIYERILEHRDRKLDNEEASAILQKQIDETRRAYDRLKTRLKQVTKDVKQCGTEIQAFQLQKQVSLNQIDVSIPISMNQIFMFEASGSLTGPDQQVQVAPEQDATIDVGQTTVAQTQANAAAEETKVNEENGEVVDLTLLSDPMKRMLVAKAGSKDFCLIQGHALTNLRSRIGDLRVETEDARKQYGELKKERVLLSKLRDTQQEKIGTWKAKVRDLQMLKFGREIDLDDLEAGSNRSREDEAERGLKEQEDAMQAIVWKLTKEGESLREKLAKVMVSNTELLRTVGELTEQKLNITRDLNGPGNNVSTESKDEGRSEREERQKVIAYVQLQAREIEALRAELIMLKRKEAPQMSQIVAGSTNLPGAPANRGGGTANYDGQLPPIPGAQSLSQAQMSRTNQR